MFKKPRDHSGRVLLPLLYVGPEASPCILKPELCQAHLGIGRDIEFEEKHHNKPHIVYLAATDKVKVGVTRNTRFQQGG